MRRLSLLVVFASSQAAAKYEYDDSHLHISNYVQEGVPLPDLIKLMDGKVGRAAIFGIPLQQEWSHRDAGDDAPTYYLDSDAPLYYYSFVDAAVAMAVRALPADQRARLDPMICGFNPADMYAADHIKRVLLTFPGVFEGIGEFTIHKEFVSSKIAGTTPSLTDPALDRILDFAAEAGLVVLLHNDLDRPFAKEGAEPTYLADLQALFKRHPKSTIIWAHIGLGRVIQPVKEYAALLGGMLDDPAYANLSFDISWIETAKYIVASPESVAISADLINRHPDRFLFGSDEVAPKDAKKLTEVYEIYAPLWQALRPEVRDKVLKGNFERLFDAARTHVRAWEKDHKGL
jgi:hypothetical protein